MLKSLLHHDEDAMPSPLPASILNLLSASTGAEEPLSTEALQNFTQKMISAKVDLHNLHLLRKGLKAQGSVSLKASRHFPLCGPISWSWPSPPPLCCRLGHTIFGTDGPCPACGQPSDRLGDHAMNCAWQGERIARHNSLGDALNSTAVKAALGPTKEGQYLLPGEGSKPANIFIPWHAGGKDAALDVTVVNPLQAALVAQAAKTPGQALKDAHNGVNIGWYWSVLGGTGSILGGTDQYLVVVGQYWLVLVSTCWYWVNSEWYWSVFGGTGSILVGTGQYLVVLGHYFVALVSTWW